MSPVLVTFDVWAVLVLKFIEVTEAVAPHEAVETDSVRDARPARPAAPAIGARVATPNSRTAAVAAVLLAVERVMHFIDT
jgi:hypothetical protein